MKDKYKNLGEYIEQIDIRNTEKLLTSENLVGLSMTKEFRKSTSNIVGVDLSKYKIVSRKQFACDFMSVIRVNKLPVVLNLSEDVIVSPAYTVFKIKDEKQLLSEYLMIWMRRSEFDRFAFFKCDSAVRGGFDWNELYKSPIIVPSIIEQQNIVKAYNIVDCRINLLHQINDKLETMAHCLFEEELSKEKNFYNSTLEEVCNITTGNLNSEDATPNGKYPFFTCSQETYKTDTFAFDQEAVLLAGNNASAIYPLKIFEGKFNAYQRTYVISSKNNFITNKQIYLTIKQKLSEFKEISLGTTTKFLTMRILNSIPIRIPKENIATKFNNKLNVLFSQIKENDLEISQLLELRQLIISHISGM